MDSVPNLEACTSWISVDMANHGEMNFMIKIQPVDEQPNNVVRAQLRSRSVRNDVADTLPLFIRICAVPRAKRAANETQIFFTLDPFVDLMTKVLETAGNILEVTRELTDFRSVFF
jgi:hypothetical protein